MPKTYPLGLTHVAALTATTAALVAPIVYKKPGTPNPPAPPQARTSATPRFGLTLREPASDYVSDAAIGNIALHHADILMLSSVSELTREHRSVLNTIREEILGQAFLDAQAMEEKAPRYRDPEAFKTAFLAAYIEARSQIEDRIAARMNGLRLRDRNKAYPDYDGKDAMHFPEIQAATLPESRRVDSPERARNSFEQLFDSPKPAPKPEPHHRDGMDPLPRQFHVKTDRGRSESDKVRFTTLTRTAEAIAARNTRGNHTPHSRG